MFVLHRVDKIIPDSNMQRAPRRWLSISVSFGFLLAANLFSQTPSSRPIALNRADAKAVATRQAAIQKGGRFLGWKFAAQSHQDTRKWQRPPQDKIIPLSTSIPRPMAETARDVSPTPLGGTSGFGTVGFDLRRPSLPAGFIPTAVTTGDFNEDGKMDFAVSNGGDNTIYVFLGNGDGTFQVPEVLYTQGQSPVWITSVRLRTNGHLDLAVVDGDSNTVEVFPGNGDGTFQASSQFSVPQIPTFVLATDANSDGNQDLVVGLVIDPGATEPQFAVLLGNGAGGFSGTMFPPTFDNVNDAPLPTGWIAAGDINNDGYVDFVTTVTGGFFIPYLNQSGKSFLQSYLPQYNDGPMVVGLADLDEDGCLDLVQFGTLGLVTFAKGSCDGNFDPNANAIADVGDLDPAIAFADVDGDGHLDVIGSGVYYPLADNPEAGKEAGYLVSVLKGDGKGNLSRAPVYRGGADAQSLVVADFLGNNRPDILTADSLENQLTLFNNDGTGKYGLPEGETIGYPNAIGPVNAPDSQSPIEVADLNGDGKPDLLLVEYGPTLGSPAQLTGILNDGTGNFLPPAWSPITNGNDAAPVPVFVTGAFRSLAPLDVIYANTYDPGGGTFDVLYFAGNGDATFAAPVILATLYSPQRIVAGDFNNDGKLDFAVFGTDSTGQNWELDIFAGHGDGTFSHLPAQLFSISSSYSSPVPMSPQQLFAVDLNHDGKLDLLVGLNGNDGWVASGDDLLELLGNGDGTFQAPTVLVSHFGAVAVADVNKDGFPDLIQNRDPNTNIAQSFFFAAGVTVYLGSASGTFTQQPSYDIPGVTIPSFNPVLVGDFNGDGIPDIAVRYWPAQPHAFLVEPRLFVLQGVGDGTFITTGHQYQLQAASFPSVGADFNGDGATDLVELTGLTSSFHTIRAAPGPALDIAIDATPIIGNKDSATVTLNLPAASSRSVSLSASDPAIQLPANLQFAAGQQTQSFSFTLGAAFDAAHVLALYAKLGTQTAVAYATKPNPNLVTGVGAALWDLSNPNPLASNSVVSVEPGESLQLHFGVTSEGGYAGTFSSLACAGLPSGTSCSFDRNSLPILPGGSQNANVTIATSTSTPFGLHSVTVSTTDGFQTPSASFELGVGDFSFSVSPTTIVVGPTGNATTTIKTSSTFGLNEPLQLSCSGLPSGTGCAPNGNFSTSAGTGGFGVSYNQLVANDYPFQITGTADIVSHTINAILRVGDFTASLDKTTATLSNGQSATFNLTLTSVNHYTNTITVFCQSPSTSVTCSLSGSPVSLTDDGVATVQLMVTDSATGAAMRPIGGSAYLLGLGIIPIPLLISRRRKRRLSALLAIITLGFLTSCGGGSSSGTGGGSGGAGGGGGGGGGTPQTVNISVVAQAASTYTDFDNQKTLSPIVITLD
jgi:FG-GAP-like repeat